MLLPWTGQAILDGRPERNIEQVARSYGFLSDTPEHDDLRRHFMEPWENIAKPADRDADGRVSLDEYVANHDSLLVDKTAFLAGMAIVVDRFMRSRTGTETVTSMKANRP
jgi:hypothetical protein